MEKEIDKIREFSFEYFSGHNNDTNVRFSIPVGMGGICWNELMDEFVKFLSGCGFHINDEDLKEWIKNREEV